MNASRPGTRLRIVVTVTAFACLGASAVAIFFGAGDGPAWAVAASSAILLAAMAFERPGYKPPMQQAPPARWERTAECFLDPATGRPVTVFIDPATGERKYVFDPG